MGAEKVELVGDDSGEHLGDALPVTMGHIDKWLEDHNIASPTHAEAP